MPIAIHQLVAGFSRGDAISNEALTMRAHFREWGHASEIFCEPRRILPELRTTALDIHTCAARLRPGDVVILHLSIGSLANDLFPTLPGRKVILYHNVTPAHYFRVINPQIALELERGRRQLERLAGTAAINLADSAFNARELEAAGYAAPAVLPLILNLDDVTTSIDRRRRRQLDDGRANVLFVGRCVPNKCIEDLLVTMAILQRAGHPGARLIHVGSHAGSEPYYYWLRSLARELRLEDVVFAGALPQAELNACYATARLFLSMSAHEGFCIPLLEAMAHDVPVLAHDAGAVSETLDGAGVLFSGKAHEEVAEMAGRLLTDASLRAAVIAGQRARLERYRQRNPARELRQLLAPLLT